MFGGVPTIVVCGRGIDADDASKSLVEVKDRRSGERVDLPLADVVAHVCADALLGAAGLGDIGEHFPDTDPEWKGQSALLTAHYDHLGVGPEIDGDTIYNGVVDNALGVACVAEIARTIRRARPAPRRSVLILFTSPERARATSASSGLWP